jgi:hypothetical protein
MPATRPLAKCLHFADAPKPGQGGHERQMVLARILQPARNVSLHRNPQPLHRIGHAVHGLVHIAHQLLEKPVADRKQQRVLVREVLVEQRRRNASLARYLAHRGGVDAVLGEHVAGHAQDLRAASFRPDPPLHTFVSRSCHRGTLYPISAL